MPEQIGAAHLLEATAGWTALAAADSWIGFDIVNSATLTSPYTRQWVEMQAAAGAPWIGTLDDPVGFLTMRGWQATVTPIGAPDANYGRWPYPPIPDDMPNMPRHWFVTATRGDRQGDRVTG